MKTTDYQSCAAPKPRKPNESPFIEGRKMGLVKDEAVQTRYVRTMIINKDTNTEAISEVDICTEARISKNRARVKLLQLMHTELEEQKSMETAYGYNPINDMSYTGEFEAIS